MKKLFFFLLLIPSLTAFTQLPTGPEIAWQRCYGGSSSDRFYDGIALQSEGIIAVIGSASSDGDLTVILSPQGWVIKFNDAWEIQWQKFYTDSVCERSPVLVNELPNGHLIFFGYAGIGCLDFHGNTDFYLMETDAEGNLLWEKCYGSPGFEEIEGFTPTSDKGFLIQGRSRSVGGDIPFHYGDGFTTDAVIIKTDSTGTIQWVKVLGGTNNDSPLGNPLEVSPGIYQVHIGSHSENYDLPPVEGAKRWIIELNNEGEIVKENLILGDNEDSNYSGRLIKYGTTKTMFISGINTESAKYTVPEGHAEVDGAIYIFNDVLDLEDVRMFGGSGSEILQRVTTDENGNLYLLGYSNSSDYDLPANNGSFDYWIMMVDSNLNLQWSRNFGGSNSNGDGSDSPFYAGIVTKNNLIVLLIYSRINLAVPDFDIECELENSNELSPDAWLVAFDLATVSTEESESLHNIQIYPNPSENYFNIEFTQALVGTVTIEMYNLIGQLSLHQEIRYNGLITVNTQGLLPGFYTIVMRNQNHVILSIQHIIL